MSRIIPAVLVGEAHNPAPTHRMLGGGLEGAERTEAETVDWNPMIISPDMQINPRKDMADARSRDMIQNDGYATGVIATHRDSIVGSQYRLNAQPEETLLGATEGWAEEFQAVTETEFNLLMDSPECWIDAGRSNTLTGLLRLAIGGFLMTGEVLGTAEWLNKDKRRPFSTAFQMVSPTRLSNPDGRQDDRFLRRGVALDNYGGALGYWFRMTHPSDWGDPRFMQWKYVEATKPWGRRQVLHIVEPMQPDQTRGISDMVSVLKNMRMTKKFRDVTLQNAVVNASYAAAIESELPSELVFASMGVGQEKAGFKNFLGDYMETLTQYAAGSNNIAVDGVKMPHLFPGTKLALKPMGTPGGVGTQFEDSLLRHTAAALGVSYEQLSRDYSKTNYSSARASMAETWKFMQSRKKIVADRTASTIWLLWLEERINAGAVPLPRGKTKDIFYDPVMREALANCNWIGASRGQIDEMKETQSAMLRIQAGLSTREAESARLGDDYRRNFKQLAREQALAKRYELDFTTKSEKPGAGQAQSTQQGNQKDNQDE